LIYFELLPPFLIIIIRGGNEQQVGLGGVGKTALFHALEFHKPAENLV